MAKPVGARGHPSQLDSPCPVRVCAVRPGSRTLQRSDATGLTEERGLDQLKSALNVPAADSPVGRTLAGVWRLEAPIGQGGIGTVYRARHLQSGLEAAVKVLSVTADPAMRERFARSLREAAQLHHPGLVRVLDGGIDGEDSFIAMALVDGESLADRQQRLGGSIPFDEARAIVATVAETLAYLHDRGVIHRDIKPSNVLLTREGQPLLTDFDLVRAVDGDGGSLTKTGTSIGTMAYMAPEQVSGREVGPPADLWALGALYHELVVGEPPFGVGAPMEIATLIIRERPAPVAERAPGIPASDAAVIDALLAREPGDRPAGATAVAAALRGDGEAVTTTVAAVVDRPPAARPSGRALKASRRSSRRTGGPSTRRVRTVSGRTVAGEPASGARGGGLAIPAVIVGVGVIAALAIVLLPGGSEPGPGDAGLARGREPGEVVDSARGAAADESAPTRQAEDGVTPQAAPGFAVVLDSFTPDGDPAVTREANFEVRGRVDGADASVTVRAGAAPVATASDGTFSLSAPLPETDGPATVIVTATDPSSQAVEARIEVIVDRTAPAVEVEPLAAGPVATDRIAVRGRVRDVHPASVVLGERTVACEADGAFELTLPLETDGEHRLELHAVDRAGNRSAPETVDVVRDATPPTITLDRPGEAERPTAEETVEVSGRVADAHPPDAVTVAGRRVPIALDGTFATTVPLAVGETTIAVVATDAAGNTARRERRLVRDATAPVVTLDPEPPDVIERTDRVLELTGTTDEPATVTVGGKPVQSAVDRLGFTASVRLRRGRNEIEIVAEDDAGNVATRTLTLRFTGRPPREDPDAPPRSGPPASIAPTIVTRREGGNYLTLAWSPDGRRTATGGWSVRALIKDDRSGADLATINLESGAKGVQRIVWSADGRFFAFGRIQGSVELRTPDGAPPVRRWEELGDRSWDLRFADGGRRLVALSFDKTASLLSLEDGSKTPITSANGVQSVAVSPDGKRLAVGDADEDVTIVSLPELRPLVTVKHHDPEVMIFTRSNRLLVASGQVLTVNRADTGAFERKITIGSPTKAGATRAALSPDERYLAVGFDSGGDAIRIVDLADPELPTVASLPMENMVVHVEWAPDGKRVAASDSGGNTSVWELWPAATSRDR